MNRIIATDNLKTKNWSLDISEIGPGKNFLFIKFTEEKPIVTFKNLRFGYELKQDSIIQEYNMYPPPGIQYERSDQEYLVSIKLNLKAEETYSLFLWAENDGQKFEKEFEFTTPRPEQPYPSWTWNSENKVWNPPVPYPDDGKFYQWDEETQNWVEIDDFEQ
jgi:hypothetical protein